MTALATAFEDQPRRRRPVSAWQPICGIDELTVDRGVCAAVDGRQVAVFLLSTGEVYALHNRDPFSGAYVLSRGIVGSRADVPVVVSPMHKQAFDLRTGVCLDDPDVRVETVAARVRARAVEVARRR